MREQVYTYCKKTVKMSSVKGKMSNAYVDPWDMLNNFFMSMLKVTVYSLFLEQVYTYSFISDPFPSPSSPSPLAVSQLAD